MTIWKFFGAVPISSPDPKYWEKNLKNMKKELAHFQSLFSTVLTLTFLCLTNLLGPSACLAQTYDLVHRFDSDTNLKVQTQLQYSGSVIVDQAGNEENEKALPLDVQASLIFDQRISSSSSTQPQAIRLFEKATANIKAGKGSTQVHLPKDKNLVIARIKHEPNENHVVQIASIENTLTQKEYELLKTPGDSLAYSNLFNKRNVKVGEKWQPAKALIADLVSVNRAITSDVSMMLKSVEKSLAKIYIYGRLRGEVDDAITDMNIKGIALLDLENRLVTSLRMTIDEERRSGQVAPGFEGKIKIDSRFSKTQAQPQLSKQRLAEIYRGKKVKFSFYLEPEKSNFVLRHDTKWRVIASQQDAAVLRLMDDGQLIGQCNIVELPKRPADNPLSLDQFKSEISRIIEKSEGAKVVQSNKSINPQGHQVLNVNVDGFEQGIPFRWLYYHVAANDGRRVTFVFTLEEDTEEYFDGADTALVNSFEFKSIRSASQTKTLPKKR